MASATYVYCVVQRARKPVATRVPEGLDGAHRPVVHALEGDLWLVTAAVPLDRYGADALEVSLRDFEWVSSIALAHEAVVEYFARSQGTTVVPMKLFTMFSSIDRASATMRRRRRVLEQVFRRIEGCEEWGVRVIRRDPRPPRQSRTAAASGTEFLMARKRAKEESRTRFAKALDAADVAFASLSEIARDQRRRTDGVPDGATAPLLDAAFLVPARRRAKFHAVAERIARDVARTGSRMTLTGPWPPYNFVAEEVG
jgi:Gas vesicle synthesis protein GvpL/GvpF